MAEEELNFGSGSDALARTDEILSDRLDEPKSLSDYTDHLYDNPSNSGHKQRAHYLLDAIKSQGTREVVEKGEEKERWRFFDDPTNNGEHAIIGNTDMLNSWVNDLEKRVKPDGAGENRIDWFEGATATGKSEFRKNIISGLKAYSRDDEGRIYTIEWAENGSNSSGMTFHEETGSNSYVDAPGVEEPLNLFPEDVQRAIEQDINNLVEEDIVLGEGSLLPPSKKERERLWEEGREGQEFSEKFDEDHVRVKNVELGEGSEGRGIRTVNAEESDKEIQHLLLGEWMLKWAQEGQPPEREYDGLNAFNFIEEGQQFLSKIPDLKNFIDNNKISGTVDIHMDNYTMILSNEVDLDEVFDRAQNVDQDSIQRRTNKHSFDYLTNFRQETGLLRKELSPKDLDFNPAIADEIDETRKPLKKNVISDGEEIEIEYAPHSLESASMYAVISRLTDDLPKPDADQDDVLSFIEKAELFESGEITRKDSDNREEVINIDNIEFEDISEEGKDGIPVTYVRDTLADVSYEETGASLEEYDLDLGTVVTPVEIVDLIEEGLDDSALLEKKADDYRGARLHQVRDYALDKMEDDVLDAIFMDITPDQGEAKSYMDHFFAKEHDEKVRSDATGMEKDPDPYTLKEFEIKYLGFDENNYSGAEAEDEVEEFRDKLRTSMNRGTWESRDKNPEDLRAEIRDNPLDFGPIKEHISAGDRDWDDIPDIADGTRYGEFDPAQWTDYFDPLSFEDREYDTDTENVKYKALRNMVEEMDYSPEAAVKTARKVLDERVL